MKSFVISLIALLSLFVLVFANSFFVSKACDEMSEILNEINGIEHTEKINKLEECWGQSKFFISLSVPHRQMDEVEKNITVLKEKSAHMNENEFFEIRALLQNAIWEINNHGALNLDNVLFLDFYQSINNKKGLFYSPLFFTIYFSSR
jgi:hypothetical protein